jgi:hypothetical protein
VADPYIYRVGFLWYSKTFKKRDDPKLKLKLMYDDHHDRRCIDALWRSFVVESLRISYSLILVSSQKLSGHRNARAHRNIQTILFFRVHAPYGDDAPFYRLSLVFKVFGGP